MHVLQPICKCVSNILDKQTQVLSYILIMYQTSWGWAGPSSARLELSLETSSLNWVIVQLISNWDNAHHLWVTWIVLVLVGYKIFKKVKEQFKRGSGQVILLHVQYMFLWNRFLVKLGFIWHTLIMIKECDLVKIMSSSPSLWDGIVW